MIKQFPNFKLSFRMLNEPYPELESYRKFETEENKKPILIPGSEPEPEPKPELDLKPETKHKAEPKS